MRWYVNLKAGLRYPLNRDKRKAFRRRQLVVANRRLIAVNLSRSPHQQSILMVTHNWGGGTERHVKELTRAALGSVNVVNLRITENKLELTIPGKPDQAVMLENTEREELITALRYFGVNRVHIHHILGQEMILRLMIERLLVSFDITIHDYYLVCPQIHLYTPGSTHYCGELGEKQCDQCIARGNNFGARDIREWRTSHAWFVENAQRVICPSRDVKDRIIKYYPSANLVLAPHEATTSDVWIVKARPLSVGQPLRVALLGHLVAHKGRETVEACLKDTKTQIEFVLVGAAQPPFADLGERFSETGVYTDSELMGHLEELAPHVVWFPQAVPETYSYTLTAAIDSGLPILASRIGAFPERLEGRPLTWLVDAAATAASQWLATLDAVREQLLEAPLVPQTGSRAKSEAFYPAGYLSFLRDRSTPVSGFGVSLTPSRSYGSPT
jgi:glycosyltransferase involved in cell wall biosynthesis